MLFWNFFTENERIIQSIQMFLTKLFASQLSCPTGLSGKLLANVWNRRNAALNNTVLGKLALQSTDRVLDVGFGGGYLLKCISVRITFGISIGMDISPSMVATGIKKFRTQIHDNRLGLICAAAEAMPCPTGYYTKVCSVNSIFYWKDAEAGLREILRVLKEGGMMVLCLTSKESIEIKDFARHIRLFETKELEKLIIKIGFQDVQVSLHSDKYRQFVCMTAKKCDGNA